MKKRSTLIMPLLTMALMALTLAGFSCSQEKDDTADKLPDSTQTNGIEEPTDVDSEKPQLTEKPAYVGTWERTIIYENDVPVIEAYAELVMTETNTFTSENESCEVEGQVTDHGNNQYTLTPTKTTCPEDDPVKYDYKIYTENNMKKMLTIIVGQTPKISEEYNWVE